MSDHTRRGFLVIADTGAAAVGAAVATGSAMAGVNERMDAGASTESGEASARGPVVAYIEDLDRGEIVLISGESRTVLTDRALVSGLARLAAKGGA
ncbi:MAG TPA: hypothetical protein VHM65_08730 [Candidatus Lustribacter sp.]|nr:hypothetical protein [Candidatus Lustribacter sp.]